MQESGEGDVAWTARPEAEEAFARFVTSREAWSMPELESLCASRPDLAGDLRRLATEWRDLAGMFARAGFPADALSSTLSSRAGMASRAGSPGRTLRLDPGWSMPGEDPDRWVELTGRLQEVARHCADPERYVDPEALGTGGMGEVWRVRDTLLDRDVALKVVKGDPGAPPWQAPCRRLARFEREVRVLGRLDHPGILRIHDFGIDAQGRPYFTMPVVEGRHFGHLIEEVWRRKARPVPASDGARAPGEADAAAWDLARAVGVLHHVSEAMAYAHERGVVHRDLKPTNVMVGRFGEAYVMDWGLAKLVRDDADAASARSAGASDAGESPRGGRLGAAGEGGEDAERAESADTDRRTVELTLEGRAVGTAAFMAPEQALAQAGSVGPAADIYALGAMLYQLLTGHPPYLEPGAATSPQDVIERLLAGPPRPLHAVAPAPPAELAAICERAMARDPSARYPGMQALAADLRAWLEGRVVRAHRTGALVELSKWVRRNRLAAAGLAAAVLALVVTVIVFVNAATVQRRLTETANASLTNERLQRERADEEASRAVKAEAQAKAQLAVAQARAAELASQRGRWKEVISVADASATSGNDSARMHVQKARALIALARSDEAREELIRAASLDANGAVSGERLLLEGYIAMLDWGSPGQARDIVSQAIEAGLEPADEAFAQGLLSDVAARAESLFAAALRADPFHFLAWDSLVQTQFWRGRFTEALQTADRMAHVFPDDPTPAVLRCTLACLAGDDARRDAALNSLRDVFDEQALADFQVFVDVTAEAQHVCPPEAIVLGNMPFADFADFIRKALPRLQTIRSPVLQQALLGHTPNLPFVSLSYGSLPGWFTRMVRNDHEGALSRIEAALEYNPAPILHFLHAVTLLQGFHENDAPLAERVAASLEGAATGDTLLPSLHVASVYLREFLLGYARVLRKDEPSRRAQVNALLAVRDEIGMPKTLLAEAARHAAGIGEAGLALDLLRRACHLSPDAPETASQSAALSLRAGAPWLAIEEADRCLRSPPAGASSEALAEIRAQRERAIVDLAQRLDAWRSNAP